MQCITSAEEKHLDEQKEQSEPASKQGDDAARDEVGHATGATPATHITLAAG